MSAASVNSRLRQLLAAPGLVRALAPHDAYTARLAEQAGAELLFLGGFGMAASALGLPDLGLATLSEMTEVVRRIADRAPVPLIADGDTGHGGLPNVARTVREFERAGAAGILLEDQQFPKRCGHFAGKSVIPARDMVDKLRAALDARVDPNFVIIARTDARAVEGLDAALERQHLYAATGVDLGFVESPCSLDELARIGREAPLPQLANMLVGGATPIVDAATLAALGFKIVVDPLLTLAATGWAVRRATQAYLTTGRVDAFPGERLTFDEIKQVLGVTEILEIERKVAEAATAPWHEASWIARSQFLLDSFRHWLGRDLIPRGGTARDEARRLFEAPRVIVAHGVEADPLLNYANRRALALWETDLASLVGTPSRLTAEPVAREDRERLLVETRRHGYVDHYEGVRISRTGRRFRVRNALVWNLIDAAGTYAGQAATFDEWTEL